jgi:hypothetical protein
LNSQRQLYETYTTTDSFMNVRAEGHWDETDRSNEGAQTERT